MEKFGERIRDYLLRCRDIGELAHAYSFVGPNGSGKKELIEWFCTELGASETIFLKSSISEVRDALSRISHTTFDGGRRMIICEHAERLTVEAGNALLTSIEEPPEKTLFLFSAPNEKAILQTIVSRCQIIRMPIQEPSEKWRAQREESYRTWRLSLSAPLWKNLLEKHDEEDIAGALDEQEFFVHRLFAEYAKTEPNELAEALLRFGRIRDLRMHPQFLSSRTAFDRIILSSP